MLNERNISEKITRHTKQYNPDEATDYIVNDKCIIVHTPHSGNKRCKSTDYGNESSYDNRFSTIFLKKMMSLLQMTLLENSRIRSTEHFFFRMNAQSGNYKNHLKRLQ